METGPEQGYDHSRWPKPPVTPKKSVATGWEKYIASTPRGDEVMEAWVKWSARSPDYDESYKSFVQWYIKAWGGGDKPHLTPEKVIQMLHVSEEITEPVARKEPSKPTAEETAVTETRTEEREIAELSDEDIWNTVLRFFSDVYSGRKQVRGRGGRRGLGVIGRRGKRRIGNLGGPEAAARAVIMEAGGYDAFKHLSVETPSGPSGTMQLSEIEQKAFSLLDEAAKQMRRERRMYRRRVESEERVDFLMKMSNVS
jgi:hypothetical protein